MYQLNRARFARADRWLHWEKKYNGAFIRFPANRLSLHILFFVPPNLTFRNLLSGVNLPDRSLIFPQGVGYNSPVLDFLLDDKQPKAVEVVLENGERRFLRNRACDQAGQMISSTVNDPKSVYGYLRDYMGPSPSTSEPQDGKAYTDRVNYFLNHFYLRLTAKTFCKVKGIKQSQQLTDKQREQMFDYIGEQYENHSPAAIKKLQSERDIILTKIKMTEAEIALIEKECDQRILFYQIGAIGFTFAHMIGFGYMIFFVDWLGWDIIEPLTYSATVFYTLLGIRFYRKYRTDRTGETIRETLLKIVMKPTKLVQLKDLRIRLGLQQAELKRSQTRARMLKNRINFQTSLAESFNAEHKSLLY